jgi:hypothetical protein
MAAAVGLAGAPAAGARSVSLVFEAYRAAGER